MSQIRTNAAAAMLGVSASALRSWEQRFGHPVPRRTEGGHRIFELAEIEALKDALGQTGEIASAIATLRQRGEGPTTPERLKLAFCDFNESKVDRLLEESLLVRSLERTVEEVLLRGVGMFVEDSPERCFASRYATGWLAAAKRVSPPAHREEGVMIFDVSCDGSLDALHAQALELFLRRAGMRTLSLPVTMRQERVGNALRALRPSAIVLAGSGGRALTGDAGAGARTKAVGASASAAGASASAAGASASAAGAAAAMGAVSRLVYAARQACEGVEVYDFRGAVPDTGASTLQRLGSSPIAAVEALRQRLDPAQAARLSTIESSSPSMLAISR